MHQEDEESIEEMKEEVKEEVPLDNEEKLDKLYERGNNQILVWGAEAEGFEVIKSESAQSEVLQYAFAFHNVEQSKHIVKDNLTYKDIIYLIKLAGYENQRSQFIRQGRADEKPKPRRRMPGALKGDQLEFPNRLHHISASDEELIELLGE